MFPVMLETFNFENYGQTSYKVAFVNSRFHKTEKIDRAPPRTH